MNDEEEWLTGYYWFWFCKNSWKDCCCCRTPLEKRDTKEFKNREEEAERLANEIERSDQYKQHISLENGEGDEEEKFSAVKRVAENNTTSMQSSGNTGK